MAGGGKIKALEVCELLNFVSALHAFGFVETGYLSLRSRTSLQSRLSNDGLSTLRKPRIGLMYYNQ